MADVAEMRRVVIVGNTGAGKTTLARSVAARLGLPCVELDALHWEPSWTSAPVDVFRERTATALAAPGGWVADGNYRAVRDLVWGGADTLVWLDYPLPILTARLLKRSVPRIVRREVLWNGNRETWRNFLFSRDSLLLWQFSTYRKRRREYPALFARPEYSHLRVLRFRWPGDTAAWERGLVASGRGVDC